MIIGLTIVAMGTSAPEASVSITSSLIGQNDMSVANVVGSNLFNILVVLGISSLFSKLPVKESTIKDDVPFLIFISILTLIFGIDFNITRLEGVIFLGIFIWFILSLIKQVNRNKENEDTVNELPMSKTVFYIIVGLAGIVLGGDITVDSASAIATQFGLSENLIGLTIVAVGTSLPEFVTSVIATRKGETEIAIGNVVGSNIFNIIFVLGVAAVLSPMTISVEAGIDILFMIFITILLFINMKQEKFILKKHGVFYILIYLTYMVYTIIR